VKKGWKGVVASYPIDRGLLASIIDKEI
jgi:hypothetical protein